VLPTFSSDIISSATAAILSFFVIIGGDAACELFGGGVEESNLPEDSKNNIQIRN